MPKIVNHEERKVAIAKDMWNVICEGERRYSTVHYVGGRNRFCDGYRREDFKCFYRLVQMDKGRLIEK